MRGFFLLRTANDLLQKLERDFKKLKQHPLDVDLAFNFFVTAEHILDWKYPGRANKSNRETLRNAEVLLQVTSHLASGAKHFDVEAKHHTSVKDTGRVGYWPEGYWPRGYWPEGYWPESLIVHLDGTAASLLSSQISVLDLASSVLQFWQSHLQSTP
jgi:hypothetical protein